MKASQQATQYNGDENDTVNAVHSYNGLISCDNSFQHNGNRDCTGGTGAHKQKNAHATGNSIQRNGNIGGKITDAAIRERAGKEKLQGENLEMMGPDEEHLEEEESEEESEESDKDDYG
jgi:hypothetical protein